ncbi:MAG TPA: putative lipid II flippase FtsW, partial [Actinomycetota bacterium]|nr:putative lipid II flippase FtsW [Actinomycetota bacterium]
SFLFFKRQAIYAAVGGGAALLFARARYQVWQKAWRPLLAVTLILLVLVLHPSTGTVAGGSARWISLGPLSLQPSELAKLVVVMAVASILAANIRHLNDVIVWAVPLLVVVGLVSILILLQPDFGTMMVLALTVLLMLFVAGVRLRAIALSTLVFGGAGVALIAFFDYRRTRFLAFLHPGADLHSTGWQLWQSLIALGSGHVFGVGLGASRQKWMYVPNAHTDFIFAILGEELGLLGEIVVLALFAMLLWAGIRIALRAPDTFGRLLAAGITAWFALQALVNLGAVTGVLPITGVPLPFISYGGSSLVVSLAAAGILASIGRAGSPASRSGSPTRRRVAQSA